MTGLQQIAQFLQMSYPFTLAILTQPFAIGVAIWLTVVVCNRRHSKWMALYGPAELKRRILDLQNRCAERGRENARLTARNAAILASMRAATTAQAHAMQALGGVPELYEGGKDE